MKMKKGDTLRHLAHQLRTKIQWAYHGVDASFADKVCIDTFTNAVEDATIQLFIVSTFPRSLDAACFAGESAAVYLAMEQTWGKKTHQYSMQADTGAQ